MRFYRTIKSFDHQGRHYAASEAVPLEDFEAWQLIKQRLIDPKPVETTRKAVKNVPEKRKKKK